MTWTRVDADVALEVASHEAIIRQAYKDSVGKWTWSVGLTSATGHKVERYISRPQTLEHCLAVYAWALNNYADRVRQTFKGHTLSKAQFTAALSFHWNTGSIHKASWVDAWKRGDVADAKRRFMLWANPPEIIGRRRKERDLFFGGKWSNDGAMTEYTRLTSRSTPVWSSAKRINVGRRLAAVFDSDGRPQQVPQDLEPWPDAPVDPPTLSPPDNPPDWEPVPEPAPSGGVSVSGAIGVVVILIAAGAFIYFKFFS